MERKKKNLTAYERGYSKILPCVFAIISLFIILLPLQTTINSVRMLLSYIFIPQLRASHGVTQYLGGVNETVGNLLKVAEENAILKEEIALLKIQTSKMESLEKENERLASALQLSRQERWRGVWAKVAYREPSRRGSVIIDKGADDGVELRSPVIAIQNGAAGLAGNVVEVTPKTAKVMLLNDEDFSAAARVESKGAEGLISGNGNNGVNLKYLPLESSVEKGDKVYTSSSGALFPDGILIGEIRETGYESKKSYDTSLTSKLRPVIDGGSVKEVFVMPALRRGGEGKNA